MCYWCDWTPLGVTCPAKCPNIVIIGKKYNKGTSTNVLGNFRVVPQTCAGLVTVVTERKYTHDRFELIQNMMIAISVATVATTYPTSHQVSYLAVDAILADVPSCSNLEITTLKAQMTSLQSAEANMASMLNATQTALLGGHHRFCNNF